MKKKIILFVCVFVFGFYNANAQFQPVSYNFVGNSQVLQNQPSSEYPYRYMIGIPVVTHTSVFAGNSGFSLGDLFGTQNSFEQKVFTTLDKLNDTDHLVVNLRQDVLSGAFKTSKNIVHFFGIYEEFDHINYIPASFIKLGFEGNVMHQNEVYKLNRIASKTELIQTLYYGVNHAINNQFRLGYTFKIYSGLANIQSINNQGEFYTTEGNNNYYAHHLDNIHVQGQSSGFNENGDANYYSKKLLNSGNYGGGIDLGFTYQKNKKLTWSVSVLDVGFIYFNKDIHNYQIDGSYVYEGVDVQFPETGFIDYWKDVKEGFKKEVKKSENTRSYFSIRPTKLYSAVKYGLGNTSKQDCSRLLNPQTEYNSFIGVIGFAQYRPIKMHYGGSLFFEKKWSKYLYSRINVTADNYSYSSLGAGLVANLGPVQFLLTADNLVGLSNLARSQKQSVQFGINIVGLDRN